MFCFLLTRDFDLLRRDFHCGQQLRGKGRGSFGCSRILLVPDAIGIGILFPTRRRLSSYGDDSLNGRDEYLEGGVVDRAIPYGKVYSAQSSEVRRLLCPIGDDRNNDGAPQGRG